MLLTMWVRVTGCTVFAFPVHMTGSQLDDIDFQAGSFRGDGTGKNTAVAYTPDGNQHLGAFDTRLEAIAAVLRAHEIVPSDQSVGIR